jgi:four helix bundle protein
MTGRIGRLDELRVYDRAFGLAMEIFRRSKHFPAEERFSLTDQIRRSSRSVCANIAEGWHKRRYPAAFVAKLSDAEAEAGETIVWLNFARECGYLPADLGDELRDGYDQVLGMLVRTIDRPDQWILPGK